MRFRREVHDRGRRVLEQHLTHARRISNVRVHKRVGRGILDLDEGIEVPGIRELVDVHDGVRRLAQQSANERRADESCSAGDDDAAHATGS